MKLCKKMMRVLSENLGLSEDYVEKAFGGEKEMGGCLRVNLYPKCPQPELTLGISPHSDPGGLTIVLADENVDGGLQVLKGNLWVTVKPLPNAFILNVGDQIQVPLYLAFSCFVFGFRRISFRLFKLSVWFW